jgi:hypothetical protein
LVLALVTVCLFLTAVTPVRAANSQPRRLVGTIHAFLRNDVCRQARLCPNYDPVVGYGLVAPELKAGETLAEWKTGSTPIVPCDHDLARLKRLSGRPGRPIFVLTLRGVPGGSCGAGWATFLLELRRVRGHWRASYWGPSPMF